jgi:hypothetical protein
MACYNRQEQQQEHTAGQQQQQQQQHSHHILSLALTQQLAQGLPGQAPGPPAAQQLQGAVFQPSAGVGEFPQAASLPDIVAASMLRQQLARQGLVSSLGVLQDSAFGDLQMSQQAAAGVQLYEGAHQASTYHLQLHDMQQQQQQQQQQQASPGTWPRTVMSSGNGHSHHSSSPSAGPVQHPWHPAVPAGHARPMVPALAAGSQAHVAGVEDFIGLTGNTTSSSTDPGNRGGPSGSGNTPGLSWQAEHLEEKAAGGGGVFQVQCQATGVAPVLCTSPRCRQVSSGD